MPRNPRLQVVAGSPPRARSRSRKPATVKAAAEGGQRRELLAALRTRIAVDIDNPNTPPRDLAALSRRLLEIAKELEALDAEDKRDGISEAAATADQEWPATRSGASCPAGGHCQ